MATGALANTRTGAPSTIFAPIEQAIEYSYDTRVGGQTTRRFRGPFLALNIYAAQLQQVGWSIKLSNPSHSPNWELVATIGLTWANTQLLDNPVDVWELTSNKVEKDFLNSQSPLIATLTPGDIAIIQNFLDNTPQIIQNVTAFLATAPYSTLSTAGNTAMTLIIAGVRTIPVFQPVIRHTQTTSNIYAVVASQVNVGSVLSGASIGVPTSGLAFVVPSNPGTPKTGFSYGWLKNYPQITASAFNKTQIITTYEFGLYSADMYTILA
jgi:hypothetical protein